MKILKQLKELQKQSAKELNALETAIQLLGNRRRRRKVKVPKTKMSAAARRRISQVQKLRWAKWHAKKKVVGIRRIA